MSSTVMMGAISPITAAKVLVLAAVLVIVFLYTQKTRKQATSKSAHLAPSEKLWRTPAPKPLLDFDLAKAEPIKYRPFRHGTTHVTMGIRSLNWDEWIEMDKNFIRYHDVKVSELEKSTTDHVQYVDNAVTRLACYEVLEELAQFLPARYPSVFSTNGDQLSNSATGECFSLSHLTPTQALSTAARLVQDDLILMIKNDDGHYRLDAAAVCLPGFWRLHEKFRTSVDELHFEARVPHYKEKLQLSMNKFFHKLTPEKAVIRNNFFIQLDDGLHWSHRMGEQDGKEVASWADADSRGLTIDEIHFRSERQTLRRLPKSGALLFTVRTYFEPMTKIAQEPHVPRRLAEAIRNWSPDIKVYKGFSHWENILLPYLDNMHEKQVESGILDQVKEGEFPF